MEGKVLDDAMIQHLFGLLEKDFPLDAHAPGGMITYRRTLVLSFFYKYFLTLRKQLGLSVPEKSLPALAEHHRPISTGSQDYVQAQYVYTSMLLPDVYVVSSPANVVCCLGTPLLLALILLTNLDSSKSPERLFT
jgi:hypothetical protein